MMRSCSAVRRASLGTGAWRCWTTSTSYASAQAAYSRRRLHHDLSGRNPLLNCHNRRRILPSRPQCLGISNHNGLPNRTLHSSPVSSSSESHRAPSHVDPSTSLSEQLRSVMRLLTNPVVVCTAQVAADHPPRAMTMSSFTSLTLAPPSPLVTFNVATPSRTLDAIAAAGRFNVHVLAADARGAAVASHFTRGNADEDGSIFDGLDGMECKKYMGQDAPLLEGEGVLYVLRCKLAAEDAPGGGLVPVRDHVIVVGQIEEVVPGASMESEFGLAYADRQYRKEGNVISQ